MGLKLLFICKRRPMGRDLITGPYGRFFHLPRELAARGHDVELDVLSYRAGEDAEGTIDRVRWQSHSLRPNPVRAWRRLVQRVAAAAPDWIVGCSDTYFGIAAVALARRHGARALVDAYDNYEAYLPWCTPLHALWRRAVAAADLVTVAGPSLATLLGAARPGRAPLVLPMAPDPAGFVLLDRYRSRARLGLAPDGLYAGYSGSIARSRGIEVLFEAFRLAREQRPGLELLLSGRLERGVVLPRGARYLGYVPAALVPVVLNSFDVMVAVNEDSAFGNYSFPIKLYEAMNCGVPVLATRTASTAWMLAGHPELLVPPGDPAALATAIVGACAQGRIVYGGERPDWAANAAALEAALNAPGFSRRAGS